MSADVKERIVNAAGPIFAEKGYRATVREICEAAEVNIASINYHFGDKEQLYIETVRQARQRKASQVPLPTLETSASPQACLHEYIRALLTRMIGIADAPWQSRLMLREIIRPTKACQELVEEYFRPDFHLLLDILARFLPEGTPLHVRRKIGFGIVGQCFFYRVAGDVVGMLIPAGELEEHYTVEQLADHISKWTMAALSRFREPLAR